MDKIYQIGRDSENIGDYNGSEVLTLYKAGQILPSDVWYHEESQRWFEVPSLVQILMIPESKTSPPPAPVTVIHQHYQTAPPKKQGTVIATLAKIIVTFIAGLFILGAIGAFFEQNQPQSITPRIALLYGEKLIEKDLKSPGTAKFSEDDDSDTFYQQRKDGNYEVGGWVDSQNGFGALIRNKWRAVIHYNADTKYWTAVWTKIGDTESDNYPQDTK